MQMKTKVIIVIGPPGAGKGTQCAALSEKHNFVHLSTGDMCRQAMQMQTDIGKKIEPYMKSGKMVPNKIITEIVNQRLQQKDALERGVLLDGYPRTKTQAKELVENENVNVDKVILMKTSDEICIERVLGRRVDPLTSKTYNLSFKEFMPDSKEVQNRLQKRESETNRQKVKKRLINYHKQLEPILQYFQGKIFVVNGEKMFHEVQDEINKALHDKSLHAEVNTTMKRGGGCFDEPREVFVSGRGLVKVSEVKKDKSLHDKSLHEKVNTNIKRGGGCFDEQSEVFVSGRGLVKVSEVKKDDKVEIITMDRYIGVAKVICVVRIERDNDEMIEFSGTKLKITPRHPVYIGRKWMYPIDYMEHYPGKAKKATSSSKYVYNFVLDRKEVCLLVNRHECVTFGHGFKEAWHPFYASDDVIKVLSKQTGYEEGFVDVKGSLKLLK